MAVTLHGIIPARYSSNRFPGKALVDIAGKPMFWHVYQRASRYTALKSLTLATDDERIFSAAKELNVDCLMTGEHPSGTDRVYEAACRLGVEEDAVVLNIQGDEPMLDPAMLESLAAPFADPATEVSTLATPISLERAIVPSQVKVVTDVTGNALYFSRALIPHVRDGARDVEYLGHIGLYAFRMRTLARYVGWPPSTLENLERLEQLRLLENGIPIRVVRVGEHSPGVDTPEDLERIRHLFG